MVRCPNCGEVISVSKEYCPACGEWMHKVKRGGRTGSKSRGIIIILSSIIIMLVGMAVGMIQGEETIGTGESAVTMPTAPYWWVIPITMMISLTLFWVGIMVYRKG